MVEDDRYCPRCASALEVRNAHCTRRPVCPSCGNVLYYDPKLAATVVVPCGGQILMVRRNTEPGLGLWGFPGGYVDRGENVEQAAAREVREETGLEVEITGLIGLFSEAGAPVVLAAYAGTIINGTVTVASQEVSEVEFFSPDHLPPLAFPRDRQVLEKWRLL